MSSNDLISELKSTIRGEVLSDEATLEHYSTDGSIFKVKPWLVILPRGKEDISALIRWVRSKKEKDPGNPMFSITCRGKATDQAGGPLNGGIIVRFPGYMDKVLEIGHDFVRVEPGAIFGEVNKMLMERGRFLPPYPASAAFSSIGGAVANNAAGEKSVKYGTMRAYIKYLKVMIESGAEITLQPLDHAELSLKMREFGFEGDIYRALYQLLKKEKDVLEQTRPRVTKYSTGYDIWDVMRDTDKGEVFDLSQLVCGSQGTLCVLTEIALWTLPKPLHTAVLLAYFDNLAKAGEATKRLLELNPSALEMVDHFLLEIVKREKPEMLEGLLPTELPKLAILCEFDGNDMSEIKKRLEMAKDLVKNTGAFESRIALEKEEQDRLWQVRRSALVVIEGIAGSKKALPFIEDVTVPPDKFPEYITRLYGILQSHNVEFAVWGHAGNGNVHVQPFLDVGYSTDREKIFSISDASFKLVAELGGVLSGEHNDGIMRTPYLPLIFPPEVLDIFKEIKRTFDPLDIFNPGKKVGLDIEYAKSHLRDEYEVGPPKPKSQ